MTETALAIRDPGAIMEQVAIHGNLAELSPGERVTYYLKLCESLGLNPLSKPFEYITLNGKLTLYAKKDCTDQLRKNQKVNVVIVGRERIEDVYVVTARATMPDGRVDESIGAVATGTVKGEALANALMKAETKAKRRVTLSICGLGWSDESEVETIPGATAARVDFQTGEIVDGEVIDFPAEPPTPTPPAPPKLPTDADREAYGRGLERARSLTIDTSAYGIDQHTTRAELFALSKRLQEAIQAQEAAQTALPV